MTDKEKARAYDEAIRKAQDVSHTSEFIKITDLFPQLLESEDEKIRKTLISYFEWVKERDCKSEWNGLKVDDIRAWLEKQKEQKSIQCIEFTNEFENQISHLLASVLNDEYEYNEGFVKHAAQSLLGYAKNKLKSDELDKIERLMKALQATNAQIGELVEENYKLKEQKQEWSEEDEENINTLIEVVHERMGLSEKRKQYYEKWLKSLRTKIKQEYSDEDEGRISDVLWCIEQARKVAKNENDMGTCWSAERFIKSLNPHWKPSVDQMKALHAVSGLSSSGEYIQNHLWSLYCDLQELM